MIAEIDQMLKAEGYRFLKVQPEEAGVYYRYENGTVEVILGLLDHSAFQMNAAVCSEHERAYQRAVLLITWQSAGDHGGDAGLSGGYPLSCDHGSGGKIPCAL